MSTRSASVQGERQRKRRSPVYLAIIGIVATLVLALIVVITLLLTGYSVPENAAVIGGLIALGGVFTTQLVNTALEDRRVQETRRLEDRRAQETRELEDDRTDRALRLEAERARAASLQSYLENLGELLIVHSLRDSSPNAVNNVSVADNESAPLVARAQTVATLEGLDAPRKGILLRFLYEAKLINKYNAEQAPVSLHSANLSNATLERAVLIGADLSHTNLEEADLFGVDLSGANLESSNLKRATINGANLPGANLSSADLSSAVLFGSILSAAELVEARAGGANFGNANLQGANLSRANLRDADLTGADLSSADLSDAIVTDEQLANCRSLENATLPGDQGDS